MMESIGVFAIPCLLTAFLLLGQVVPSLPEGIEKVGIVGVLAYIVFVQNKEKKEILARLMESNALIMKGLKRFARIQNDQTRMLQAMKEKSSNQTEMEGQKP